MPLPNNMAVSATTRHGDLNTVSAAATKSRDMSTRRSWFETQPPTALVQRAPVEVPAQEQQQPPAPHQGGGASRTHSQLPQSRVCMSCLQRTRPPVLRPVAWYSSNWLRHMAAHQSPLTTPQGGEAASSSVSVWHRWCCIAYLRAAACRAASSPLVQYLEPGPKKWKLGRSSGSC